MQRRKLLLGVGTAAGVAGAVGSGAFTSVSAQRDVAVQVADDSDALLSLQPGTGPNAEAFTTVSDGLVGLDFSETDAGGAGLGTDSTYQFDGLLSVRNRGTQRVYVYVRVSGGVSNDELYVYPDSDPSTRLRDGTDAVVPLDPGETESLGVFVDTELLETDTTATVTVTATANKPAGSVQGGRGSVLVSDRPGRGDFSDVQAAVDAIAAGDADATTVEIDAGTFGGDGPIEVRAPNGLQFRGRGDGADGTVLASRLVLSGGSPVDGVVIRDLRIAGTDGGAALQVGTAGQTVRNAVVDGVTVVDNDGDGIGSEPAENVEIRNSVIENNGGTGIVLDGAAASGDATGLGDTTLSVAGSRIVGNGAGGVSAFADAFDRVSVVASTVADNAGTGVFVGTPFAADLGAPADAAVGAAEFVGLSATGNDGAGVLVSSETVARVTLDDVVAAGNATDGVDLAGVDVTAGAVARVTVADNGGTGVALGSFAPEAAVTGSLDRALVEANGDAGDGAGVAVFDGVGGGTNVAVRNSNVVDNAGVGVSTDDTADGVEVSLSNVFLDGNERGTSAGVGGTTAGSPVPGVGADGD